MQETLPHRICYGENNHGDVVMDEDDEEVALRQYPQG